MFNNPFKKKHDTRYNSAYISELYNFHNNNEFNAGVNNYSDNVIVYKCVNLIAGTASHVPLKIYNNKNNNSFPSPNHPLHKLLKKPNYMQAGADFFVNMISNKLLYGNTYILAPGSDNSSPSELYILNSRNMDIIIEQGRMKYYRHITPQQEKLYEIDPLNQTSRILHLKNYHPTDEIYGMSCLQSASSAIAVHNMTSKWNMSLLRNNARPSGALIMKENNNYLTDEQFERLKEQINEKYTGSHNIGKPLLLEGGLDWKEMSINPKDMDFIESKNSAAREIALSFGVPPQLLGISGDNTYSNMQEARLALWEETIIPLLDKISDSFSNWMSHLYEEDILIEFDRNEISALTGKRENLWNMVSDSKFMTTNEKRKFLGLAPIKNGDKFE